MIEVTVREDGVFISQMLIKPAKLPENILVEYYKSSMGGFGRIIKNEKELENLISRGFVAILKKVKQVQPVAQKEKE